MPEENRGAQNERFAAVLSMLDLKDAEVAARLGIGRTFLVRLKTGSSGVSARLAHAMNAEFGIRVSWLITGKSTIFSGKEPVPGAERGIISFLNRQTDPTGVPVFVGADDFNIDAVRLAGAVTSGIWKSGGDYGCRPVTPTIARWNKCFYIWPTKAEAAFIEGSCLELVLMVVPSAYLTPRHAREGAKFVCLLGTAKRRTLAYATVAGVNRTPAATAGTRRGKPRRAARSRRRRVQLAYRGGSGSRAYEFLLDCELQRTVPGNAEVLGIAVRAERGLMWGPKPTFDD